MLSLRDQLRESLCVERATGRAGVLATYLEAHIRGNYRKGPVPVTVNYYYRFAYSESWQDAEGNTILSTEGSFETPGERDARLGMLFGQVQGS